MQTLTRRPHFLLLLSAAIVLSAITVALAANAGQVQQLLSTKKCALCDLSDAQLGGKNLTGADVSGANLSNASLYGATLRNANLDGAVLNGADLRAADLKGATGAAFAGALMDARTVCPSGSAGPCS